ncbi:MAG TPA: twin-arginine translocation pathway signal [Candidatus Enterocloster faecavium]|uniref:Twin-arginine translocation pathway signal n=1 Tax=Candidatus Enterocloster faecavium TaxID=2838560 RepID=A0A9D2RM14_9FIRM|nr:twin-arginine translocation pathway signal [Candidatus Enterocloster faecavium]
MRQARSTKAVRTIPKGAYECGTTSDELMNGDYRDSLHPGLDLQGNGYYSDSESARTDSAALKNSDFPGCVKGKPQAGGPV